MKFFHFVCCIITFASIETMLSEKSRNKGFGKGTPKNSIFVGNLAYTLEENELEELFSKYGKVLDASIIKKKNKGPMGYAFVTMSTKEEVDRCFRELNGTIFQGRRINLGSDSSQTKLALENNLLSNSNSDKFKSANTPNPDEIIQRMNGIGEYMLFVGNISNNVTHREIKDLFSQYGDVSDVSILRKKDGSSKGTCLVTMTNKQEMERCVELLHNYSLKGLRLTVSVKLDSLKETEKVVHGTNSGGGNMSCSTNGKTFSEALKLNASTKDASEDSSTSKQNDTIEIKDVSRKPDVGSSDGAVNGGERGLLDEDSMKIIISQPDWKPNKALSKQDHTLVVGNLHIECEEKDLIEKFKPYGMVVFVKIVHNTAPGALGYAYLTMANQAEADFCMEELQGRELFGKKLCIGKSLQAITSTQQYEHSLLFRFNSSTTGSEHGVGNEVDLKSEVIEKEIKILFGSFYNNNPIEGVSVSKLFSDSVSQY